MDNALMTIGRIAGVVGILVCAVAIIGRLLGNYHMLGFEAVTLLHGGTSVVVIGCFLLLLSRADRR